MPSAAFARGWRARTLAGRRPRLRTRQHPGGPAPHARRARRPPRAPRTVDRVLAPARPGPARSGGEARTGFCGPTYDGRNTHGSRMRNGRGAIRRPKGRRRRPPMPVTRGGDPLLDVLPESDSDARAEAHRHARARRFGLRGVRQRPTLDDRGLPRRARGAVRRRLRRSRLRDHVLVAAERGFLRPFRDILAAQPMRRGCAPECLQPPPGARHRPPRVDAPPARS